MKVQAAHKQMNAKTGYLSVSTTLFVRGPPIDLLPVATVCCRTAYAGGYALVSVLYCFTAGFGDS